jgi:hypothetical protein
MGARENTVGTVENTVDVSENTVGAGGAAARLVFDFPGGQPRREGASGEPMAVLSLRAAGSMRYRVGESDPARARFFSALGLEPWRVIATELHHTRRIRFVESDPSRLIGSNREQDASALSGEDEGEGGPDGVAGRDGVVICPAVPFRSPGPVPAVTVADCMPIWILDRASGSYGVLHSGWKGTGILAHAIRSIAARRGSSPASMAVILGPAIGTCCYEVPEERALAFESEFGAEAVDRSGPRPRLDLRAANLGIARALGVGAILSVDACTACESALGSYRREGATDYTRMVALCLPS